LAKVGSQTGDLAGSSTIPREPIRNIAADEFRQALDHGPVLHSKQIEESVRQVPLRPGEYRRIKRCFCSRRDHRIDAEKPT
jgi:hypothetical protein